MNLRAISQSTTSFQLSEITTSSMSILSSKQANDLANHFLGLAQAIGDFRYQHWKKLTHSQNQRLGKIQWSILQEGEDILAISTTLIMDEVGESLKQIEQITMKVRTNLKSLKDIKKGIRIAALIVDLGTAILSKDTRVIGKAIEKSISILD